MNGALIRQDLHSALERQRDQVIDLDIAVDDARQAVDRAVGDLRVAVRERDRAAVHLKYLIAQAGDCPGLVR